MEPKITISSKKKASKVLLESNKNREHLSQQPVKSAIKKNKTTSSINWRATSRQSSITKHPKWYQRNQELISITLSIVGAIIVGLIMGASLLSIFFHNEPTYSQNSIDSHLKQANQDPKNAAQTSFQVYLLQVGNFQQKTGAEDKIRSYRKQGLAAISSDGPPYQIYLGVSLDQAGAKKLAVDYENKGIKVYIKKMNIQQKQKNPNIKELEVIHQQSYKIFTELSKSSIDQLGANQPFSLQPQIEESYQQLLSSAQKVKSQLPAAEQKKMLTMIQSIDQAVQSAREAKTQSNTALMWQIQEGLVKYIVTHSASSSF